MKEVRLIYQIAGVYFVFMNELFVLVWEEGVSTGPAFDLYILEYL